MTRGGVGWKIVPSEKSGNGRESRASSTSVSFPLTHCVQSKFNTRGSNHGVPQGSHSLSPVSRSNGRALAARSRARTTRESPVVFFLFLPFVVAFFTFSFPSSSGERLGSSHVTSRARAALSCGRFRPEHYPFYSLYPHALAPSLPLTENSAEGDHPGRLWVSVRKGCPRTIPDLFRKREREK